MTIRTFAIVLAGALPLAAQTKISGTINCAKPDPMHQVDVGDRPGHVMMLSKVKCEWSKPIEMEGLKSKSGESTQSDDASAKNSRGNGYHMGIMDNGDKYFVRYQGSAVLKDGQTEGADGKWSFTNGTGKLRGLKGGGTYKGKATSDGGMTFEIEGEYSVAPAAKK